MFVFTAVHFFFIAHNCLNTKEGNLSDCKNLHHIDLYSFQTSVYLYDTFNIYMYICIFISHLQYTSREIYVKYISAFKEYSTPVYVYICICVYSKSVYLAPPDGSQHATSCVLTLLCYSIKLETVLYFRFYLHFSYFLLQYKT